MTEAVFFDVDFTLIFPGPTFRAEGYRRFCEAHAIAVDTSAFERAVTAASAILDAAQDHVYSPELFYRYTSAIIRGMGGEGPEVENCAREIYDEWAVNRHFELYPDVSESLRAIAARGVRIGLISNSHRCLASFQSHFELDGLIAAAVSSSEHGFMKPHRSIFEAALRLLGVAPARSVMVGDSFAHDIVGAREAGMRAVLVTRSSGPVHPAVTAPDIPVIRTLLELPDLL